MNLRVASLVCLSTCKVCAWKRFALTLANIQLFAVLFNILLISIIFSSISFCLAFLVLLPLSLAIMVHIRTIDTGVTVGMRWKSPRLR